MMTNSEYWKHVTKDLHLSQSQIARVIDAERTSVNKWINGNVICINDIFRENWKQYLINRGYIIELETFEDCEKEWVKNKTKDVREAPEPLVADTISKSSCNASVSANTENIQVDEQKEKLEANRKYLPDLLYPTEVAKEAFVWWFPNKKQIQFIYELQNCDSNRTAAEKVYGTLSSLELQQLVIRHYKKLESAKEYGITEELFLQSAPYLSEIPETLADLPTRCLKQLYINRINYCYQQIGEQFTEGHFDSFIFVLKYLQDHGGYSLEVLKDDIIHKIFCKKRPLLKTIDDEKKLNWIEKHKQDCMQAINQVLDAEDVRLHQFFLTKFGSPYLSCLLPCLQDAIKLDVRLNANKYELKHIYTLTKTGADFLQCLKDLNLIP